MSIDARTRRLIAVACCDRDAANAYCDSLDSAALVANTGSYSLTIPLPAATSGLVAVPFMSLDVAVTIEGITLISSGQFAGVDADNTVAVAVKDQAGNAIASKTYDDVTVPVDDGFDDLGSLNGTNKVLNANEAATITVTLGTTAVPPDLSLFIQFHPN